MNKLEAEILRLEPTLKAHKMACQMSVPGACEAADAVHGGIEARRRELERWACEGAHGWVRCAPEVSGGDGVEAVG